MRRRRYQKGSLQARRHGRKRVWVVQYYDAEGHHRYRTLGTMAEMTKGEAQQEQVRFMRTINGGDTVANEPRPILVSEFVNQVYLPFQRGKWKKSTRGTSESSIQHHIVRELGNWQMERLTLTDLQQFLNRKAAAGSYSVVAHLRWHLSSICEMAVAEKVISANPATMLYVPKDAKKGEGRAMTLAEAEKALSLGAPREKLMLHLAVLSGLRPGEFLALQRRHVASDGSSVTVEQRVYRGDLDTPKNGRSRIVAVPPRTAALLKSWLNAAVSPDAAAWVFASETGKTPMWRDNLLRRHIRPLLEKVGLGWVDFKVMRRSNATLGHGKVDPKVAADQRGHDIDVSMNVYTKTDIKQRAAVARKLEDVVLGAKVVRMPKRKAS